MPPQRPFTSAHATSAHVSSAHVLRRCVSCQQLNSPQSSFCGSCGENLFIACAVCNFKNLPQQSFCGACAAQLTELKAAAYVPHINSLGPNQKAVMSLSEPVAGSAMRQPELKEPVFLTQRVMLSVEHLGGEQLPEAHYQNWLNMLEQQLIAKHGTLERSKDAVFCSFQRFETLPQAVASALNFAVALIEQAVQGQYAIRVGADLAQSDMDQAFASVAERLAARPNTFWVSETFYYTALQQPDAETAALLAKFKPTGPIKLDRRMTQFFYYQPGAQHIPQKVEVEAVTEIEPSEAQPNKTSEPQVSVQQQASISPSCYWKATSQSRPATLAFDDVRRVATSLLEAAVLPTAVGSIISLCGNTGSGRTQLVYALRQALDPDVKASKAFWLFANGQPDFPMQFWQRVWANFLGLSLEGFSVAQARQQIQEFLLYLNLDRSEVKLQAFLEILLQVRPPEPLRPDSFNLQHNTWTETATMVLLKALSAKKPVVLVVDDAEQVDSTSMGLLCRLIQKHHLLAQRVTVMLNFSRHQYPDGVLQKILQTESYQECVLPDLTAADIKKYLLTGPVGDALEQFPDDFVGYLHAYSQGNLFLLEEQLRYLAQARHIVLSDSGQYCLNDAVFASETALYSGNPEGLLQERFKNLSVQAQQWLQRASAIGERFALDLLLGCSKEDSAVFQEILQELYAQGWVVPDVLNTARFRNPLQREVVLRLAQPALLEQVHGQLCVQLERWLSDSSKQNETEQMACSANEWAAHAEGAKRYTSAFEAWNMVGVTMVRLGLAEGATQAFQKALCCVEQVSDTVGYNRPQLRNQLLEHLALLNLTLNPEMSRQWLTILLLEAQQQQAIARQRYLLGLVAKTHEAQYQPEKALASVRQAKGLAEATDASLLEEQFLVSIQECLYLFSLGHYGELSTLFAPLDHLAQLLSQQVHFKHHPLLYPQWLQSRLLIAKVAQVQCHAVSQEPSMSVFSRYEELLGLLREEVASPFIRKITVDTKLAQASAYLQWGAYEPVQGLLEAVLAELEAMPDADSALAQWGLLAVEMHYQQGHFEEARALIAHCEQQAQQAQNMHAYILSQCWHGMLHAQAGRFKQARTLIESGIEYAASAKLSHPALMGWRMLADLELMIGSKDVALEVATQALVVASKASIQNTLELYRLCNIQARCLLGLNRATEAGPVLEGIWGDLVAAQISPLIAETATNVALLYENLQLVQSNVTMAHETYAEKAVYFRNQARKIWNELKNAYQVERLG